MIPFCARFVKVRWDEKLSVYCVTENPDQILASSTKGNRAEQGIPVQLRLSSSFLFLCLSPFFSLFLVTCAASKLGIYLLGSIISVMPLVSLLTAAFYG